MGTHFMIGKLLFSLLLIFPIIFSVAVSDTAKDKEECSEALVGIATFLPYVKGGSKVPTPDCCMGLKQVLKTNEKCLCVVVKDGNDPHLGLNISITLAVGLPRVCNAHADMSRCPVLLYLDPNSPEAQIFKQFGTTSNSTAKSSISSPSPSGKFKTAKNDSIKNSRIN